MLLGKGKDAIFDLMDAVLTSPRVNSFVELSLSPVFRRAWSSLYAGLRHSRPPRQKLMKLAIEQIATESRPLLAGDHTAWTRPEAVTLKDRTIEHQPTQIAGNKPITVGHGFSTIAWVPEAQGSWALPLRHERITSFETPLSRAAFQLKQVCLHLRVRPIAVYEARIWQCFVYQADSGDCNRPIVSTTPKFLSMGRSTTLLWQGTTQVAWRQIQTF